MGILGLSFLNAITCGLYNQATAEHEGNVFERATTHFGKLGL